MSEGLHVSVWKCMCVWWEAELLALSQPPLGAPTLKPTLAGPPASCLSPAFTCSDDMTQLQPQLLKGNPPLENETQSLSPSGPDYLSRIFSHPSLTLPSSHTKRAAFKGYTCPTIPPNLFLCCLLCLGCVLPLFFQAARPHTQISPPP